MSMLDTVIAGGELVLPEGVLRADLGLKDGRIAAIFAPGSAPEAAQRVDATGLTVIPGAIDIHFHVRAPAYPERGTVESETRAAAAGGVTTIFEMPISKPCCASIEVLEARKAHFSEHAVVDFALYAAPGPLTEAARDAMVTGGAIAFKIFTTPAPEGRGDEFDGLSFPGHAEQMRALELIAPTGLPLVVHAEDAGLLGLYEARGADADPADGLNHSRFRPAIAEAVQVAALLTMNRDAGAKLHIAHVTCRETLAVLRAFAGSSDFSAETCPHYLTRTEEDVARVGVYGKVNPPIRSAADRTSLWEALRDGTLGHLTTDHAPFSLAEKARAEGNFPAAPPGVPGVELLVPLAFDAAARGRLRLEQAVGLITAAGARRFGLYPRKGTLLPGADADLALVDRDAITEVKRGSLVSHARDVAHLFEGMQLRGRVMQTWLQGRRIYHEGRVTGQPGQGRFVAGVPAAAGQEGRDE